jgi:hypothetical protein
MPVPHERADRVDHVDVIELHSPEGAVEFGGGILVRPVLPPQLVGDHHRVALPAGGTEQLAEDDLGVAGRNRCGACLVVVAGVVEEVDACSARGAHDIDALVARNSLERAPRAERHHADVTTGRTERAEFERHGHRSSRFARGGARGATMAPWICSRRSTAHSATRR